MSSVRMCDNCGEMFSERRTDWGTAPVTRYFKDPVTKERRHKTEQLDFCPNCYVSPDDGDEGPTPRMPGQPDYSKIKRLEHELLDRPELPYDQAGRTRPETP